MFSGRQHWVEKGRWYDMNHIKGVEKDRQFIVNRILLHKEANGIVHIGRPFISYIMMTAHVMGHFRGTKMYLIKYKPKKHQRTKMGFRPSLSRIMIDTVEVLEHPQQQEENDLGISRPSTFRPSEWAHGEEYNAHRNKLKLLQRLPDV
eukprot:GHVL01021303.1.p1 GENE.GHVL01021303.1~~GHVL01021303.1.p1  ORF type:complete len:148 (+),score=8.23 GHVL01021303.1:310-753(+)